MLFSSFEDLLTITLRSLAILAIFKFRYAFGRSKLSQCMH